MKPRLISLLLSALAAGLFPLAAIAQEKAVPYAGWANAGTLTILTTPDGANLPAAASVDEFPLLVRLHRDWFDFSKAKPQGEDVRFSSSAGESLAFEIEDWDATKGEATLWVRVPRVTGNARQTIRMHWGKADAASESDGKAVFNESNGYLSVWHMGAEVRDVVGTLESKDTGTTLTEGMTGKARHFPGKLGVFCGDRIPGYPSGGSQHTTEWWFRPEQPNGTILGWGNEGGGRGSKVRMQFRSPPHLLVESDFSDARGKSRLPMKTWIHAGHTYGDGPRKVYINGQLDAEATTKLDIKSPARLWLGGWYNNYDFVGDLDEVRVSKVARSPEWMRLQYENQKPLQTLVGMVVPMLPERTDSSIQGLPASATVSEGQSLALNAKAPGAHKLYWTLKSAGQETCVGVDRFAFTFNAGRVTGDQDAILQCKAVFVDGVKMQDIAIKIREEIQEPVFTLEAPATWDGRTEIAVVSRVKNLEAMQAQGAGELTTGWSAGPFAVTKEVAGGKLTLKRAQNSGSLTVTATMNNGGQPVTQTATIQVTEPKHDAWIARAPEKDEKPEDGQFYARDDKNEGTLHCNGTLAGAAEEVFLKLYGDDRLIKMETARPGADLSYAFAIKLRPGLIKYKVEFGTKTGGRETVLHTAGDLVCGDAYIIEGQSNALATDTREQSPPDTHEWIRSYGRPPGSAIGEPKNLWCHPVWKAQKGELAELGWWGMELAKRLVESQKVPVCIINGAVGGTRIDQHQRNAAAPADLSTIYGRMLWRVQQAKLTHGIRAILWHQGESDQGADGPTGGYGWETYQPLFLEMAAGWKQDFPNVQHYYVFQIWPNACAMAGREGSGDRLRERQRTLPSLFSRMSIMSTLGVRPPGGCHFPLEGWAEFARLIQPLMERDLFGKAPSDSITPPNLVRAAYAGTAKDTITLEFDQPVLWTEAQAGQFYLDGEKAQVASGSVSGNVLTLRLKAASSVKTITYLKETAWSQETLLYGANGLAALTFCEVPLQ